MPTEKVRTPQDYFAEQLLDYFAEQFTRFQIDMPVRELIKNGATAKVVESEGLVFLYFNDNGINNGKEVRQKYYIFAEDDHSVLIKLEDKKIREGFYDRSFEVKTANSKGEVSKINATDCMIGFSQENDDDPDLVFIILNTQATKEILLYQKIGGEGEEDNQENTIIIKGNFSSIRRIEVEELKNKLLEMAKRKGNMYDAMEAFIEDFVKNTKENTSYVLDFSDMSVSTITEIIRDGKRSLINEDKQNIPGMLILKVRRETVVSIPITETPDEFKNIQLKVTNMCDCRFLESFKSFVSIKTNGADQGPYS